MLEEIARTLKASNIEELRKFPIKIVKKSFDGRWKKSGTPHFVYTVDVTIDLANGKSFRGLQVKEGRIEILPQDDTPTLLLSKTADESKQNSLPKVVIVGAGPAGLFAALYLAEAGFHPVIIERGKPVETRGQSIGALFNRKKLDPESNLCYGEGGAGTWSDGKLTTRIGKNSRDVREVLEAFVEQGAPQKILIDGKPHLGTDRLVRILKNLRAHLIAIGAEFMFDSKVVDFKINTRSESNYTTSSDKVSTKEQPMIGRLNGLILADGREISADVVVLSVGHSARPLYERLHDLKVTMKAKPIAAGFRIEHPQSIINQIQYGKYSEFCLQGNGPVPVADYRLASNVPTQAGLKGCYSFCMCPGGQIGKNKN